MHKTRLVGLAVFCCFVGCLAAAAKPKPASPADAKIPSWAKVSKAQIAEAKKLGVPVAFENASGLKFVLAPAGEFMMGSPDDEPGSYKEEKPQHKVKIRKAFYISIHQTTQGQWRALMGTKPWLGKASTKDDPLNAVTNVCWNDAMAFCAKLGKKDGGSYGLPSEAQWEYACRAGTTTRYCYGDDPEAKKLGQYAWYLDAGWNIESERHTHHVGVKKPNNWGVHDMHGNVWELCADAQHSNFEGAPSDDRPWMKGSVPNKDGALARVLRGGGLRSTDRRTRSASRYSYPQTASSYYVGFRVSCALPAKAK
ncbi:MAG: formylglycine-generating enzyme family protein [Phycisphaerae bacterium]|jgi:formylglycine-generating enzyme required for sulfatase activity|nr:formylglycine-generating enzyme family protein [Phycisphaerae bacterium]